MKKILAHLLISTLVRYAVFCLIFLWGGQTNLLFSSHIVGGEISYEFLSFNEDQTSANYRFKLTLYRDPTGIIYDQFANFGIYRQQDNGSWESYLLVENAPRSPITEITRNSDPCKTRLLNNERLQSASYSFEVSLELGDADYLISYQRCCRNYTINNIQSADEIGAVYDVVITAEAVSNGNNSPVFSELPPIFVCSGFELLVDNSAIDSDGDSLVYSFCNSIFPGYDDGSGPGCCGCVAPDPVQCTPPYLETIYIPPFSAESPMAGNPLVQVDAQSGLINGIPELNGAYVVAVCVDEYRDGVLMSKTRRDFEFNVVDCIVNLNASLVSDSLIERGNDQSPLYFYESCNELNIPIQNSSTNTAYIDDYRWEVYNENNFQIFSSQGLAQRDVNIVLPTPGTYTGIMYIFDGDACADSSEFIIQIIPPLELDLQYTFDSCIAGPITFESPLFNESEYDWIWNTGDGNTYSDYLIEYTYDIPGSYDTKIDITDANDCLTSYEETIDWFPLQLTSPDTIKLEESICYNDSLWINDFWVKDSGTYYENVPSVFNGCDSIIKEIKLEIKTQSDIPNLEILLCKGDSIKINAKWIDQAGYYTDTLTQANNCDSLTFIKVVLADLQAITESYALCQGDRFEWNGIEIIESGTFSFVSLDQNGCDSTTLLEVEILLDTESILYEEICTGDTLTYASEKLFTSGQYAFDLFNQRGCDSTVLLELTVHPDYINRQEYFLCQGDIYERLGSTIDAAGEYSFQLRSINDCDSTIVLQVNELLDSERYIQDTICEGEFYDFNGRALYSTGLYSDTLVNTLGCDSLVSLDLIVGTNLSRIDFNEEPQFEYGTKIKLESEVIGGDLISMQWYEVAEILSNGLELEYRVTEDEWIYFESINELYCLAKDSIFIKSIIDRNVYIPNVISPDNDGLNELFNIGASESISRSQTQIFDRWGNLLYSGPWTKDKAFESGWDGTFNGKEIEVGTYTYLISVEFIDGNQQVFTGSIQLIR